MNREISSVRANISIEAAHCSLFSDFDVRLFQSGRHYMLYKHFGAHRVTFNGVDGVYFAVWAPAADHVAVIGDFNYWNKAENPMSPRWDESGIWETFIPGIALGTAYKFHIRNPSGFEAEKADPFGFLMETPPNTASRVTRSQFKWTDKRWTNSRKKTPVAQKPISVYEVHLGSWRRIPEEGNRWLSYRELAAQLPQYVADMGFTHVELMPIMEHPFFGSWGYQQTGYFAPSARFGSPDDLKFLINELHKFKIGVILDWVPSHFPDDSHGLGFFDGTHLYEHADPREGYHPDWKSNIFNYGRHEVKSFLISNALYWLEEFHIDGFRVDAVASMLYRDYSRNPGEWIPNKYGGRENLEAIAFLQEFNSAVHHHFPDTFTVAEESTAFPGVTRSVTDGGLGFDFKWMMGWMHDTLSYFRKDPIHRSYHQNQWTFSLNYAFSERFILPLSHDESVHGKGSLINKMPGDEWQKMANLRLLYGYMYGHPGGKLLFMGGEFAQYNEWHHDGSLDWHLLQQSFHQEMQRLIRDLNQLYTSSPALYENGYAAEGFEWIDFNDASNSVLCWIRKSKKPEDYLVFIANATPTVLHDYRLGIDEIQTFTEIFNTDHYGGGHIGNNSPIVSENSPLHGRACSLTLTLPPLALIVLKPERHKAR